MGEFCRDTPPQRLTQVEDPDVVIWILAISQTAFLPRVAAVGVVFQMALPTHQVFTSLFSQILKKRQQSCRLRRGYFALPLPQQSGKFSCCSNKEINKGGREF